MRVSAPAAEPPSSGRPRVIIVSHVPPWPASAGNEYRLARMIAWLESVGYEVHLVYRPLGDAKPKSSQIAELTSRFPRLYLVDPEAQLVTFASDTPGIDQAFDALPNRRRVDYNKELARDDALLEASAVGLNRQFAPDELIDFATLLTETLRPVAVIVLYVFMSRLLPFLPAGPVRMIDLIDVFSTKRTKVERFGVREGLAVSDDDEARLIRRADVAIAIQPEEAEIVARLVPDREVVTAGIDYAVMEENPGTSLDQVLVVGSDNLLNTNGLIGFLRYCWPTVLRAVPTARLAVVGSLGKILSGAEPGVSVLGRVDDLDAVYASSRVAINPSVAGTGVKVKTLEAIAHLRPIVVWPAGAEGLSADVRSACTVVTDWHSFTEATIDHLANSDGIDRAHTNASNMRHALSPEATYRELAAALERGRAAA